MTKFENIEFLDQIDWNSEISSDKSKPSAIDLSESFGVWNIANDIISASVKKATEDYSKANGLRLLQYFWAKYFYCNALYYSLKEADIKKSLKEDKLNILNFKTKFAKSSLPLKEIEQIEEIFLKQVRKVFKKMKPKGNFEQAQKMFHLEGLEVIKPLIPEKDIDRDTCCIIYDEVHYHMYLMKSNTYTNSKRTQASAKNEADDYKQMIERYHPLIKKIYQKIQSLNIGHIWAMEGGGIQQQVFFGNDSGYLAILYLDMKNETVKRRRNYTLQVNRKENNKLFKNFGIEGIKIEKSI
jgi:hypothetical protein